MRQWIRHTHIDMRVCIFSDGKDKRDSEGPDDGDEQKGRKNDKGVHLSF